MREYLNNNNSSNVQITHFKGIKTASTVPKERKSQADLTDRHEKK